ncbi:MAG: RibD family protein [Spirochaetia bacterium]|jgi:riboflavin-specific deaminase-like protein
MTAPEKPDLILEKALSVISHSAGAQPVVTLSWARSTTGAIAAADGVPVKLSGPESLALTHRLRAAHDAILVGIQTVLNDDPLLSVRFTEGPQPQPVVLDSRLRFPLTARLLSRDERMPWIFYADAARQAQDALQCKGAVLFAVSAGAGGLDLGEVLRVLRGRGISSVMVEGGARVLRAFIDQRLADQVVVTTSPLILSGLSGPDMPILRSPLREMYGSDIVLWGRVG